jgi:hypothetical protein
MHAWQGESLAQILEVFKFYDQEISLWEIIYEIKERIKDF